MTVKIFSTALWLIAFWMTMAGVSFADTKPNPLLADKDISFLYHSCKSGLAEGEGALEKNYCYQMISAMYPTLYAVGEMKLSQRDETTQDCAVRKYDAYRDVRIIPSSEIMRIFLHEELAETFISFVDSEPSIQNYPLLTSQADKAMVQTILVWAKTPQRPADKHTEVKMQERARRIMHQGDKPDAYDLVNSCQQYNAGSFNQGLCHASISGGLVIFSLFRTALPVYSPEETCRAEKEAIIEDFLWKRGGCFPNTDIKADAAAHIAQLPNKRDIVPGKGSAAYTLASVMSSQYACRRQK